MHMVLWGAVAACTGSLGSAGDEASGTARGDETPAGAAMGSVSTDGTGSQSASGDPRIAARVWRLSPEEIDRELVRLFGDGAPQLSIPPSAAANGITNIAENAVVDRGNASLFVDGMRAVADWVTEDGATRARCRTYGDTACVETLLDWLPGEAFRRPVTSDERAELRTLFEELARSYPYDFAISGVVRAVLLSPDFLYRTELGEVLSPYEIANLLAFAITGAAPDTELLTAAENADLTDPNEREAQARRLMDNSERVWQRFFWEWLHMQTLYSQGVEVGLSDALVAQMESEYQTFVREVVVAQHGKLRDVLSAPYTWVEPELAAHYGATHPGAGVQRVALDPQQRGGVLTQGAWLVSHGKDGRDNVVRRGMGIFKDAMCNNNLRPPDGLDVEAELAKLVAPDASPREVVEARGSAAACMGCHRLPDPMGMVFETFTSDGRWQATYPDGLPVDSNVTVAGIGDFDNARLLSEALATDEAFQQCFVRRFVHLFAGVDLGAPAVVAWSAAAHRRLAETDGDLEEMVVALVKHPAFIERRLEVAP